MYLKKLDTKKMKNKEVNLEQQVINTYLPEIIKKEGLIEEIFVCLLEQGFNIQKDMMDLYYLVIKTKVLIKSRASYSSQFILLSEITFSNIMSKYDISFNNHNL